MPPTNWLSNFGGSAWESCGDGWYYLHLFAKEQPDGTVLVDILSDPSLPLTLNMQILVGTDGSHTFERLDLNRP